MIVLVMFLILLALICLNVPIAVGLAVAAIFGVGVSEGLGSIVTLALDMYDGSTKFSLIAIPMF
ncbi:TRAP transporter large permease, partial [Litoricolaceae bacterium]|nr:TRAP transporter large permease [Litorivicinaceae bacterium]